MRKLLLLNLFALALAFGQTNVSSSATVNSQTANGSVTVTWQPKLTLALSCPSSTQVSGTAQTCTAIINIPAPAGGAVVNLTSGDTTKLTVPASVTIPAGATSTTFTLTAI